MKISTICLGSCSGCHISILGLGEDLLPLLEQMNITYSPLLMDRKQPVECDLAIIEGGARNDEDLERLSQLRQKAKKVLAIGSCAVYGGISSIANITSREELALESYEKPNKTTPKLEKRYYPIDHYIEVDYYLPGCPPPRKVLLEALPPLIAGKEPPHHSLPVCAECKRKAHLRMHKDFVRTVEKRPEPDECLLSQGYICLGSVTRSGCGADCTRVGVPCLGCRGPADRLLTKPSHGIYKDLVRRRAHLLGISEKEVEEKVFDLAHTLYTYTLGSSFIRHKSSEKAAEQWHRVKVDAGEEL